MQQASINYSPSPNCEHRYVLLILILCLSRSFGKSNAFFIKTIHWELFKIYFCELHLSALSLACFISTPTDHYENNYHQFH